MLAALVDFADISITKEHSMRRLPFPAGLLAAALLVPLISLFSAANASAVAFTDTTFADADWLIRSEAVTPGSSHTFGQDTTPGAGNPSPYRRMTHTNPVHPMGSGSTFTTITHERETWSYDPAVSGAIDHIDISMDRIVFSATVGGQPSPSSAVGHVFRIYQDGLAFFPANDPRAFLSRSWENIALTNLAGTDFVTTTSPGALNPDFSAAGGVITFGYGRSNTNTAQSVEVITTHGIDNFTVTVVPIPEPSTLLMIGVGMVLLGSTRR